MSILKIPEVEVNKNVIVNIDWTAAGSADNQVTINNVSFIPDAMIVRSISYMPGQTSDFNQYSSGPFYIFMDLISEDIGNFIFATSTNATPANVAIPVAPHAPNSIFSVGKPVMGTYNFQIHSRTGAGFANLRGVLTIHLDFVKYKTQKQVKVY